MPPLVSILIPTFDRERYLPETLASAVAQTYPHTEVLVCDNASTDATVAIAERAAAADPRVRVVAGERNVGPVENFRRCMTLARGEYLKFLMSDDLLHPDAVARLLEPMLRDPGVVLATSKRDCMDADGRALPDFTSHEALFPQDAVVDGVLLGDHMLALNHNSLGEPSTPLLRRSAVDVDGAFAFGGRRFRYLADVALWLDLLARGRAVYVAKALSRFRVHAGQDQRDPALVVTCAAEWLHLLRTAGGRGYLADPRTEDRGLRAFVANTGALQADPARSPREVAELQALVDAAIGRLRELGDPRRAA